MSKNYAEEYHVPHVHPGLFKIYDFNEYKTELMQWHSLQVSPLAEDDSLYRTETEQTAYYYLLWPNMMLNIMPGRLQLNIVEPLTPSTCRIHFDYYYGDSAASSGERDQEFSHEVQLEDIGICELVQRGLTSLSYSRGRYSPKRERALHHFHDLIRASLRESIAAM